MAILLSSSSLIRLVVGIRLHRELPDTKLILSGWGAFGPMPEAVAMSQVAQALGVMPQEIIIEEDSPDTEAQARIIKSIVRQDRFILLTSAIHLPRALALFRKQGMEPVPCPVGHLVRESQAPSWSFEAFFPSLHALSMSNAALHEYLGMGWARLKGLI